MPMSVWLWARGLYCSGGSDRCSVGSSELRHAYRNVRGQGRTGRGTARDARGCGGDAHRRRAAVGGPQVDHHRRRDARHHHAGARRHRDERRAAAHPGLAVGRRRRGLVGPHLLSRRQRHHPARHRVAGRRPGTQAVLPRLHHRVHAGLDAVRAGPQHRDAADRPRLAGHRRRAAHAAVPGHHVGDLSAPAARHGHGGVGRGHHDGADLRADPRGMDLRQLVVALDLLHQPAHRHRRPAGGQRRAVRPVVPQEARAHRRDRARAHGARLPLAPALPRPGRAQRVVRLRRSSSPWPSWP